MLLDHPLKPESDTHAELTKCAQAYAIQVRKLSDAVATLGLRIAAPQQIQENTIEVKRLEALVERAREELLAVLESPESRVSAASQ